MEETGMVLSECPSQLKHLSRLAISPQQRRATHIDLNPEQHHYLHRVRRLQEGDPFLVFDGSGRLWQVIFQGRQSLIAQELSPCSRELPIHLHLGLALTKGGEFDEGIRHLTELGVQSITPLLTTRTLVNPGSHRIQRWQKIVTEAAEQSERLQIPIIYPPQSGVSWFEELVSDTSPELRLIAVARGSFPHLLSCLQDSGWGKIRVAIGPEGGWTEAEIQRAQEYHWKPISLGSRILRAVTAPLMVASLVAGISEWQKDQNSGT
jgi:16S rRNA (uracil1498-N3)-methyltransferase